MESLPGLRLGTRLFAILAAAPLLTAGCGSAHTARPLHRPPPSPGQASTAAALPAPTAPAVSSSPSPSVRTSTPAVAAAGGLAQARAAWPDVLASYGTAYATSGVLATGGSILGAVSSPYGQEAAVAIYRFSSGGWQRTATVDLYEGGTILGADGGATPIREVDVTGGPVSDFAVTTDSASAEPVFIVSDAGGRWHVVPFVAASGARSQTALQPSFPAPGVVTSTQDNCVPDCASGTTTVVTFRYDPATATLRAA